MRQKVDFHERFIWRVIENTAPETKQINVEVPRGEMLVPGKVFRMGRLRFRVREVNDGSKSTTIDVRPNRGVDDVISKFQSINSSKFEDHQNKRMKRKRIGIKLQKKTCFAVSVLKEKFQGINLLKSANVPRLCQCMLTV